MREKRILLSLIRWITYRENELSKKIANSRLYGKSDFDKNKVHFLSGKVQMCRDILEKVEEFNDH